MGPTEKSCCELENRGIKKLKSVVYSCTSNLRVGQYFSGWAMYSLEHSCCFVSATLVISLGTLI